MNIIGFLLDREVKSYELTSFFSKIYDILDSEITYIHDITSFMDIGVDKKLVIEIYKLRGDFLYSITLYHRWNLEFSFDIAYFMKVSEKLQCSVAFDDDTTNPNKFNLCRKGEYLGEIILDDETLELSE